MDYHVSLPRVSACSGRPPQSFYKSRNFQSGVRHVANTSWNYRSQKSDCKRRHNDEAECSIEPVGSSLRNFIDCGNRGGLLANRITIADRRKILGYENLQSMQCPRPHRSVASLWNSYTKNPAIPRAQLRKNSAPIVKAPKSVRSNEHVMVARLPAEGGSELRFDCHSYAGSRSYSRKIPDEQVVSDGAGSAWSHAEVPAKDKERKGVRFDERVTVKYF